MHQTCTPSDYSRLAGFILGGVEGLNGVLALNCEGLGFKRISGEWVGELIQLAKCFLCGFCCILGAL